MFGNRKDNANTNQPDSNADETVIEAQPIILGADEPVFVMPPNDGETVYASATDEPIILTADPVATDEPVIIPAAPADDTVAPAQEEPIIIPTPAQDEPVIIPTATQDEPIIIPTAPNTDDNVIIPMGADTAAAAATESESLDDQLAAMLAEPSSDNEIEEIEQQVNAILRQDVISPLDEQLLISLQERLETLLNGPAPTASQPIAETPTTSETPTQPSETVDAPASDTIEATASETQPPETAETETVMTEPETPAATPETADANPPETDEATAAAEQPIVVEPVANVVDAATRAVEAEKAKAALLAYLAAKPATRESDTQDAADRNDRTDETDPLREIDALKKQIKELEMLLRRQARDDDRRSRDEDRRDRDDDRRSRDDDRRDRDDDRRSRDDDRRDRDDDRRRFENALRRAARRSSEPYTDRYYEQPPVASQQHDKPSSILDNLFQQWFESEVTEKFRSLFDDKKESDRRGDEPKEIRPEVVTVSDPDTLPGLVPLGKNLYFNPTDGKAYYIAPVSSLPPGMPSPTGSAAKKPVRKRPATRAARPRARRRPMRSGRRRSPFGRPLRRPPPRRY